MTDATVQAALSIGVPTIAVLISTLLNNSRQSDLRAHMDARFDDMKDMWRSELHRVEEVLDARLKHLEERAR
jgi:predicted proteasome-type protease